MEYGKKTEKYSTSVIRTYSYVRLSINDRLLQNEVDGRNNNILLCLYTNSTKIANFDLNFEVDINQERGLELANVKLNKII